MKYYAGLDVSLEETAICMVDETGAIVKEARASSDPQALSEVLRAIGLELERIGLEACSLTAWLHDGLRAEGFPALCIETRQANAAMKTIPVKTDRNDARALAQIMRTGWFRQVHVKSRQCRLWRSLLVARRTVLNEMRSIENVVRALLREAGLKLGTLGRTKFVARVRELADREEKRVTRGNDTEKRLEHLDLNDPNQRGLLELPGDDVARVVVQDCEQINPAPANDLGTQAGRGKHQV